MIYSIHKGRHRALPLRIRLSKKRVIEETVIFHDKYILPGVDQYDTNKLFGCSYTLSPHKESARFGWCYNPERDRIVISAYCYVNGKRGIYEICDCRLGVPYTFTFEKWINKKYYFLVTRSDKTVLGKQTVSFNHDREWWYGLHLYFGGNRKAPEMLQVEIKSRNIPYLF